MPLAPSVPPAAASAHAITPVLSATSPGAAAATVSTPIVTAAPAAAAGISLTVPEQSLHSLHPYPGGSSPRVVRPRKSHIKSRKGCANCKRRRIKCDEDRPQCFNCTKHGVRCDYLSQDGPPQHEGQQQRRQAPATSSSPEVRPTPLLAAAPSPVSSLGGSPSPRVLYELPGLRTTSATFPSSVLSMPASLPSIQHLAPPPIAVAPTSVPRQDTNATEDPEFSGLHMVQLELLHHFLVVTAPTFSDDTDGDLWLNEIPRMAFGSHNQFLMYAILTMACTHMKFLREQDTAAIQAVTGDNDSTLAVEQRRRELQFERAEVWYRQRALETFRAAIMGPWMPGHLQAMWAAGSLIAIQSFAYKERKRKTPHGRKNHGDNADGENLSSDNAQRTIVSIDKWLPVLLGIRTVVSEMRNNDMGQELHSVVDIDFTALDPAAHSSPSPNATAAAAAVPSAPTPVPLRSLIALISSTSDAPVPLSVYLEPLTPLSQLIQAFQRARPADLRKYVITWPFLCSEDFLARLRVRDKIALVIFVHFLGVLSLLNAWWQEERVRVDVRLICRTHLREPQWRPWLEWVSGVVPFRIFD
ncbi:uncharacterized protein V1518DRAFT_372202 [Limtongia smithiae]|uniref:uncharacterized protein n=1 Tax=Limtongia smithiae TaxID=1125753 RepID=UPI0034CDBDEE